LLGGQKKTPVEQHSRILSSGDINNARQGMKVGGLVVEGSSVRVRAGR
jgi:hypothetical protein